LSQKYIKFILFIGLLSLSACLLAQVPTTNIVAPTFKAPPIFSWSYFVRVFFALGFILLLVFFSFKFLTSWWQKGTVGILGQKTKYMEVVDQITVEPTTQIFLVKILNEFQVLTVSQRPSATMQPLTSTSKDLLKKNKRRSGVSTQGEH